MKRDLPMITDWNDAYDNAGHIDGAREYPPRWNALALSFREEMSAAGRAELDLAYGTGPRNKLDLFLPAPSTASSDPKGLAVFVHGGFWKAFDKSTWSHLARGAVEQGWAICLPSYSLAPEARISTMTGEIAAAISFAALRISGPIHLSGHSAGGHLVSRMVCADSPLPPAIRQRLGHVLSISGLHDLRPLLHTEMNKILQLDATEAQNESAALHQPAGNCPISCWVGADERPAFLLQNDLLATVWAGLGAETEIRHQSEKHHFDVINDLANPDSALTNCLLQQK
ncbi:alpha/beta hydrolase [Kiloniella laminariae]|uniref:alpha/beta hydrolase n=1 Tax=Kiloniella laminariae TaxID=454162 RepID=UPI00037C2209|nr:alpha/beta hydrolase [Kiloniella laminariae]